MTSTTLSIVVPTYNRGALLRFLLESVADDFETWPSDLELVVLDNASTDDTPAVVQALADRGVPIRPRFNKENIGMDANLAACFDAATGKYLWQIGDDELLYRGAASFVLDLCRHQDFGLLHLHGDSFGPNEQLETRSRSIPGQVTPTLVSSRTMIRLANVYLTFISANIINRRAVEGLPGFNAKAETNTFLPHMAWIYGVLLARDDHFVIDSPFFGTLVGNTGGYRLVEVFGRNLHAVTQRRLANRFPASTRIVSNAALLRVLPSELRSQLDSGTAQAFVGEDVRSALRDLFGARFYYRILVRHVLSPSSDVRRWAYAMLNILNRVNRMLRFRLL